MNFEVSVFNISPILNDTDIYIQLTTDSGHFQNDSADKRQYELDDKKVTILKAAPLITGALPSKNLFSFEINTNELEDLIDHNFEITLCFGGKLSAPKYNYYKIGYQTDYRANRFEFDRNISRQEHLSRILFIQREENLLTKKVINDGNENNIEKDLPGI